MPNKSEKESAGQTKGGLENLTRLLTERGFKPLPRQRGVRVRLFENPKVPLKPITSEKDSTEDES